MSCLHIWNQGGGQQFLDAAAETGRRLGENKVQDSKGVRWQAENGAVYVGYAHGASGVALFLLYLGLATGDRKMLELGREALSFDLAQGVWLDDAFAGFPARVTGDTDPKPDSAALSCYWDTGSAGVGTTLLRYLKSCPTRSIAPGPRDSPPTPVASTLPFRSYFEGWPDLAIFFWTLGNLPGMTSTEKPQSRLPKGSCCLALSGTRDLRFPENKLGGRAQTSVRVPLASVCFCIDFYKAMPKPRRIFISWWTGFFPCLGRVTAPLGI